MKVLCSMLSFNTPQTCVEHSIHHLSLDGSNFLLFNLCLCALLYTKQEIKLETACISSLPVWMPDWKGQATEETVLRFQFLVPRIISYLVVIISTKAPASSFVLEPSG